MERNFLTNTKMSSPDVVSWMENSASRCACEKTPIPQYIPLSLMLKLQQTLEELTEKEVISKVCKATDWVNSIHANSPGCRTNLLVSRTSNKISRIKATLNLNTTVSQRPVSECTQTRGVASLTQIHTCVDFLLQIKVIYIVVTLYFAFFTFIEMFFGKCRQKIPPHSDCGSSMQKVALKSSPCCKNDKIFSGSFW